MGRQSPATPSMHVVNANAHLNPSGCNPICRVTTMSIHSSRGVNLASRGAAERGPGVNDGLIQPARFQLARRASRAREGADEAGGNRLAVIEVFYFRAFSYCGTPVKASLAALDSILPPCPGCRVKPNNQKKEVSEM
jgi:hypothetical protein